MPGKIWIGIVIVVGLAAIGLVWTKRTSLTAERDIPYASVSSSVPAPAPGQKKVVLKNLGMT